MDICTKWVWEQFRLAEKDEKYSLMKEEYLQMQRQFEEIVRQMPMDQQDILWGFITLSDGMHWRMLELLWEDANAGK